MTKKQIAAFDDIETLSAMVSENFGDWGQALPVTQLMIDQFADLTGDHQWIHVDVERAKTESPFGNTIAHGLLILSLLPAVNPQRDQYQFTGHSSALVYGTGETRFLKPVTAGSAIKSRCRMKNVEKHSRGTLLTFQVAIHGVDENGSANEKPSVVSDVRLLYT